ncbi:hypothetical protein RHGRI_025531 [Rhododendron griersonianum]|uniref:Uncharacterized protein n=1 Tax=Rhododendron griersonianum TaxID=479676 RepID=A0AAV6IVK1_9ERIC|nr:hypothetical protein RHGRI_025531 [Rhododendron griersonianum]
MTVNGRRYNVRVVEEETFSTVTSTYQVSNPEAEEEDDEVDKTEGDRNASRKKNGDLMDDMEKQNTSYSDDLAKRGDEEAKKGDNNDINCSHQSELEKEPTLERALIQEETVGTMSEANKYPFVLPKSAVLGNIEDGEGFNEESTNSIHGLDSIVPDSQSPWSDDGHDSVSNRFQVQNIEAQKAEADDIEEYVMMMLAEVSLR